MQIDKQLFEDVLSGKLKGTFVWRNGKEISSYELIYNNNLCYSKTHPYKLRGIIYTPNGLTSLFGQECYNDIVDFIPDTDMKENELTIEIPNDKIIDWEESKKQNKIVLKDKPLTYEDICNRLPGMIDIPLFDTPSEDGNALVANEHQLECILAKNKLANVAKYLNDWWKSSSHIFGYYICICGGELEINTRNSYKYNNNIIFKTKELAQQAIEILGEETVKLALEPLGI